MMKIFFNSVFYLLVITNAIAQNVGINTINPQTLFHVDGKGNTSGNSNYSDDLVITSDGNMGIGTLSPNAKVHLESSATNPIRIEDGTDFPMRVLTTDNDGFASWAVISGVMYMASVNFPTQTVIPSVASNIPPIGVSPYATSTLLPTDVPLVAPEDGNYLIVLRWWGWRQSVSAPFTSIYVRLWLNTINYGNQSDAIGTAVDVVEHYFTTQDNSYFGFNVCLYASAKKDDVFKLTVLPTNEPPGVGWVINGVSENPNGILRPSILVVKI